MTGPLPDRIGRYRVRQLIGVGAFATVYRALDERLGVDVAVKVLAENHSLDADVRSRFVEEGRRLRRASGSHLIAVHDIGETERAQPYLVLDLADRGDLATRVATVRRQGRCPGPDDVLALGQALTAALRELHRHQIVHRDLTPKNLLLRSTLPPAARSDLVEASLIAADEQLALADLGLSKDLAVASGLTVATGTSGFAPPEQREHAAVVDHRADIWAASALVVWLALDRAPDDEGRWQHDLRHAGWSPDLARATARGLAHSPHHRYPIIDEWYAALEHALRPPTGTPTTGTGRAATRRGRWRPGLGSMLMMIVALLVGATADGVGEQIRDARTVTTEPSDNGSETTVEEHGVTIRIDGPTTVPVDESLRLTATVDGAEQWIWVGPDGALAVRAEEFVLDALDSGHATVRVLAIDQRGRIIEATRPVTVTQG
ncbi:MAG: serine/threonine-protein kinase [Acidimicrobiales bacterium]